MSASILTLFTTYLIYPLLAVVLIVVAALVAKKNGLLKNKRLIAYTLLSVLILALPAVSGLLDYNFMPYAYLTLMVVYLIAGYFNDRMLAWVFNNEGLKYRAKITYTLFQSILVILLFTLIFNLCNELKYGLWASMTVLPFILISLLSRSYQLFIHIPMPVYKVWNYDDATGYSAPEDLDHSKLKVVKVEVFKREEDTEPIRINAKVPDEMLLGDWIKLLFEDYNKKSSYSPIYTHVGDSSGWIFYVKSWALAPRRYLDYEQTVKENRIKEHHLVVAKRVKQTAI